MARFSGKIVLIDPPHPHLLEKLKAMGFDCHEHFRTPKAELTKIVGDYDGLIIRSRFSIDEAFLSEAGQLRFIARYGVGLEHIDVEAAARSGIAVFNSPEGSRDTVAEHTLGLLLMLMNHLHRADREVRAGSWRREANRGLEIKGKTVGILGYGNMGAAFARRLSGFGARVIAYDKYKEHYGDDFAQAVSLEELFRESDILSLHIPYTPQNHYFVDGPFLDRFHKPVFLINTARGLVLRTADLAARLQTGKVRGAALDVLEYEEPSFAQLEPDDLPAPFQYLRRAEQVVLTPHIAGWSAESKLGHARVLAEKIEAFMGGALPEGSRTQ